MSDSSESSSPLHMPAETNHFFDPKFTAEISQRMRVPKRIKVDGECDEPVLNGAYFEPSWATIDRLDMRVPERIIVLGNHEHLGTRPLSPPEMAFENATRPPDPSSIRIQTPPRVITLDKHHYPSADEYNPPSYMMDGAAVKVMRSPRPAPPGMEGDLPPNPSREVMNMSDMSHVEGMSAAEEVVHLRRQLAKLNRRVMAIELESLQRQQRDKIIYGIGLAYLFIKTMVWLTRSN